MKYFFFCLIVIYALCIDNCTCKTEYFPNSLRRARNSQEKTNFDNLQNRHRRWAITSPAPTEAATTPAASTAASEAPAPNEEYKVVPYFNTGSAYINAEGTLIDAPVYNYGYYNFPKYLVESKHYDPHYRPQQQYPQPQESGEYYPPYGQRTPYPSHPTTVDDH